jgi:uncharacterized protein YgbK (DUF1537 family)
MSTPALECLLIADDLTGACDAAVHFAMRGSRTVASVDTRFVDDASVVAINAATRDLDPQLAEERIREIAATLPVHSAKRLFKKIDSVLRGNAGREVAAAVTAFGCDAAILTPAFPALGRTVESGWLRVNGTPTVEIASRLRDQSVRDSVHTKPGRLAAAVAGGARVVSLDAASDRDLDAIVEEGMSLGKRVLWAGSGGLASALARAMPLAKEKSSAHTPPNGPVLFCIGSDHPETLAQQQCLLAERPVKTIMAANVAGDVATALRIGPHVLLRVPRRCVDGDSLRKLIRSGPVAALLLSGGDTASAVCEAMGAHFIELHGEIAPGVPRGMLRGGEFDGLAVVTKSGGFGAEDALVRVADFFSAPDAGSEPG